MEREKATYDPDLPHTFRSGIMRNDKCSICGRHYSDELHEAVREQAAATSLIVTEKGS